MEIRITIPPGGGSFRFETISILEDLWHDYQFFRDRALEIENTTQAPPGEQFIAKRYHRAALVMLVFYLEGVVNRWLQLFVESSEWAEIEKHRLTDKIKRLEKRTPRKPSARPRFTQAKRVRDALAHLKPGGDLEIYDKVNGKLLAETEATITAWLTEMEELLGVARHPNTQEESRPFREALGVQDPESEGYSGHSHG